jgi:TatD DNase family protein
MKKMLIDTHGHLNFEAFDSDLNEVIGRCVGDDIWVVNAGSQYDTSKKATEIAKENKTMFAAVGLHPIHAKEDFNVEEYGSLAKLEKVVAIGEIGLDRYKEYGQFMDRQKEVFIQQLNLAKELSLPAIIHCRMAHNDLLEILQNEKYKIKGVIHCFTGTWEEAKKYLDLGFYLGFNGIMYKFDLKEVIDKTPLDRILIETDCPYLTPPQAGVERNEPIFVKYIAQEIAGIKNISFEEVAIVTTQNAKNLFRI